MKLSRKESRTTFNLDDELRVQLGEQGHASDVGACSSRTVSRRRDRDANNVRMFALRHWTVVLQTNVILTVLDLIYYACLFYVPTKFQHRSSSSRMDARFFEYVITIVSEMIQVVLTLALIITLYMCIMKLKLVWMVSNVLFLVFISLNHLVLGIQGYLTYIDCLLVIFYVYRLFALIVVYKLDCKGLRKERARRKAVVEDRNLELFVINI